MKVIKTAFMIFDSLRKLSTFREATTVFPAKWRLRNERRNSIPMTYHYPDLGKASDWSYREENSLQPITSITQVWEVYVISMELAFTKTLFYFSYRFFENIGERACEASARERAGSARKKNKELSSSPTTTSLRWRSINPLRFIFYHPCSTDFEGKIEGLWTG